jgi:hypothetical protein
LNVKGYNPKLKRYPQITYYWTSLVILGNSYLVGNLTNSKIAEKESFSISKILTVLYQQFSKLVISQPDMSGPTLGALSNNR